MKKLEKKTFYTIFSIISLFIVITIIVFNVQSYNKEYNGIKTNLSRMNMMFFKEPDRKPINDDNIRGIPQDENGRMEPPNVNMGEPPEKPNENN